MNEKYRVMNQNVQICYTISNKMIELKGKYDSYDSDRYRFSKHFCLLFYLMHGVTISDL